MLIDSRTGISDSSGICTIHLPDALVVFYTLSNQSIEGASGIAAHVLANRQGRSKEPFRVWSMATRVELAEKEKLDARRLFARERFSPFLETLAGLGGQWNEDYWGEMEVLYDPFYAYDEILATVADLPGRANSILAAFERLSARITNGEVSRLGEISDTKRREALELYSRVGTANAAPNMPQRRQPKSWDIFLSANASDYSKAKRLYHLLGSSYKVFHAPKEIAPGEAWEESMMEALEHSLAMAVLFSEESVQRNSKWMSAEIQAARRRVERDPSFKVIPVQLNPGADPPVEFLKRYQWLSVRGGDMKDVALQIRRSLGTPADGNDDRERSIRIKAELDKAVEEKAALAKLVQQLKQDLQESEENIKRLSFNLEEEKQQHRKATRGRWTFGVLMFLLTAAMGFLALSKHIDLGKTQAALRQERAAEGVLAGKLAAQIQAAEENTRQTRQLVKQIQELQQGQQLQQQQQLSPFLNAIGQDSPSVEEKTRFGL